MIETTPNSIHHLLKASEIEAMEETIKVHSLNSQAVRYTKSISDAVGMSKLLLEIDAGSQ